MKKSVVFMAIMFCLFTTGAFALPVHFTDTDFAVVYGDNSESVSISPPDITITFQAQPSQATMFWDDVDGIGIEYDYEDDEIEGDYERLTVAFSETVVLSEVYITDLFNEWGYLETGWYTLNGSQTPVLFSASADQEIGLTNGELTLNIGQSVVSITFGAPGLICSEQSVGISRGYGGTYAGVCGLHGSSVVLVKRAHRCLQPYHPIDMPSNLRKRCRNVIA